MNQAVRACPAKVRQPGTSKQREIRFSPLPPGQAGQARTLLAGLDNLSVEAGPGDLALTVTYEVTEYTFHGLELALEAEGFHLDNTLYTKLMRAFIGFCEETQLRNLAQPERLIKQSNTVYVKAWDKHPHGDHDDTPPEWREYK